MDKTPFVTWRDIDENVNVDLVSLVIQRKFVDPLPIVSPIRVVQVIWPVFVIIGVVVLLNLIGFSIIVYDLLIVTIVQQPIHVQIIKNVSIRAPNRVSVFALEGLPFVLMVFAMIQRINECNEKNICGPHASCVNRLGTYECRCAAGYQGEDPYRDGCTLMSKEPPGCSGDQDCLSTKKCDFSNVSILVQLEMKIVAVQTHFAQHLITLSPVLVHLVSRVIQINCAQ